MRRDGGVLPVPCLPRHPRGPPGRGPARPWRRDRGRRGPAARRCFGACERPIYPSFRSWTRHYDIPCPHRRLDSHRRASEASILQFSPASPRSRRIELSMIRSLPRLMLLVALPLGLVSCAAGTLVPERVSMPAARASLLPEFRIFYDSMVDYGDWILIEPYGYVFRPQVNAGFYFVGPAHSTGFANSNGCSLATRLGVRAPRRRFRNRARV